MPGSSCQYTGTCVPDLPCTSNCTLNDKFHLSTSQLSYPQERGCNVNGMTWGGLIELMSIELLAGGWVPHSNCEIEDSDKGHAV